MGMNNVIRNYHSVMDNKSNTSLVARDNGRAVKVQDKTYNNIRKAYRETGT